MTTLALLTQATLNLIYGVEFVERPLEDRINGAIANGTTEAVVFDFPAMWDPDDYVEYKPDGEVTRLINDTTQKRAQRGTTGVTHADNSEVTKNPPYTIADAQTHIRATIRNDLWPHVWTWYQDTLTAVDTDWMYDLDQHIADVAMVYQENIDADERWRPFPTSWWDVERQINPAVATQGGMLVARNAFDFDEPVYYLGKRRSHVDDLSNVSDEIADLIPWRAGAKLLASKGGQVKAAVARSRKDEAGSPYRQLYQLWMAEFLTARESLSRTLNSEVRVDRRWRNAERFARRSW